MATALQENPSESEETCVLCCKKIEIYAIAVCDHTVCFECSTRMRVLCKKSECPICRRDVPKVIFSDTNEPFSELEAKLNAFSRPFEDRTAGIVFLTARIRSAYRELLEHRCPICLKHDKDKPDKEKSGRAVFRTFNELKEHVRRDHELFYCDLCVSNLKIFTSERRCYTRQERALHRRKGDPDDKSHRGHPLCEFCDRRYADTDDLYRHLRRDHFYCHFCDTDRETVAPETGGGAGGGASNANRYYDSYDELRNHFRTAHYLCEEGQCRTESFTAAFRTALDLNAHRAAVHRAELGRDGVRRARVLEFAFTIRPRARAGRQERNNSDDEEGAVGYAEPPPRQQTVDTMNMSDFPRLGNSADNPGGGGGGYVGVVAPAAFSKHASATKSLREEDFPSLAPVASSSSSAPSGGSSSSANRTVRLSISNLSRPSSNSSNLSIHINNNKGAQKQAAKASTAVAPPSASSTIRVRPPRDDPRADDFPALSSASNSRSRNHNTGNGDNNNNNEQPPRWVEIGKKKKTNQNATSNNNNNNKNKSNNVAVVPDFELNNFPALSINNLNNTVNSGKKEKKKTSVTVHLNSNCNNNNNSNIPEGNVEVKKGSNGKKKKDKNQPKTNSNSIPPGFSIKPPPGFSNLNLTAADFTFTNSSGEQFPILPSSSAPEYKPPANFEKRNENLIRNLIKSSNSVEAVQEFKTYSNAFRNDQLPAEAYYTLCKEVMKAPRFESLFSELLVLLPDIKKQRELFEVYSKEVGRDANAAAPPGFRGARPNPLKLETCLGCQQVVAAHDLGAHVQRHALDSNFPVLSKGGAENDENNCWRRK